MTSWKHAVENMDTESFLRNKYLSSLFSQTNEITDKWGLIRQLYLENIHDIMETSKADKSKWAEPYSFDWSKYFSPIERETWQSIRTYGRIPLYPQLPLFNFFIDFANPYLKIGLELDGKNYHDPDKDLKRDTALGKYGWVIFRSTGLEANNYSSLDSILDCGKGSEYKKVSIANWLLKSTDGLIYAIRYWYFLNDTSKEKARFIDLNSDLECEEDMFDIYPFIEQTLDEHTSIDYKNQPFTEKY